MAETPSRQKRCSTCRYYRASPIPGQGWCTHPILVRPPAMVLVRDKELRCARPLGEPSDYWTPPLAPGETPAEPAFPEAASGPRTGSFRWSNTPPPADDDSPRTGRVSRTDWSAVSPPEAAPEAQRYGYEDGEPSVIGEVEDSGDHTPPGRHYRTEEPFAEQPRSRRRVWLMVALVPIGVCLLIGLAAAGFVALQGAATASKPPTPTATPRLQGTAKQDFRLRAEPKADAESRGQIPTGTILRLLDSTAGEVLDANVPEPAKWYRVQTIDGRAEGWAYAAWINR